MPTPSARGPMLLALTLLTLSTGCVPVATSETERAMCHELRADLPSFSTRDTAETLAGGARFITVFEAVCKNGGTRG